MNPAEYDTKIIILRETETELADDSLSSPNTWEPIYKKWGKPISHRGTNQVIGEADSIIKRRVFEIRGKVYIDETCRAQIGNEIYEIEDIDDSRERNKGLIRITVKKVGNN